MVTKKDKKGNGLSISETIKAMKKKFGEDSVMMLDQKPISGIDSISTGSFGLDIALGIGGLPQGRIIEIYGQESTGKTTLALHTIAEAQKKGGVCFYIDAEHAMDPQYAAKLGVDTKKLLISQPSCGEEALDLVENMVLTNEFAVIVIDSVASLTPKAEIEGDMGDQHVGRQARLMSHALRKLTGIVAQSNTIVIFINQLRENIGVMGYGPKYFTPGGKALKFYSSVRLEITRMNQIKKGEEIMGSRVKVKIVKNKVAAPAKTTEFDLMFNEGISREGEILALGESYKIIKLSGRSYTYGDQKLGVGYDASRKFLRENKELADRIVGEIKDAISTKVVMDSELESEIDDGYSLDDMTPENLAKKK